MSGEVRGWPLLRPVVVTNTTGSPARSCGTLLRPLEMLLTKRSMCRRVIEKSLAPSLVDPNHCMARWNGFGSLWA